MGAKQNVGLARHCCNVAGEVLDIERVLQPTSGVIRRLIECGEVVVIEFDLGPFGDAIAEPDEDVGDLFDDT